MTCPSLSRRWCYLLMGLSLPLLGCGSRGPLIAGDGGLHRDGAPSPAPDARHRDDGRAAPDTLRPAADAGVCGVTCGPDEAYLISACVSTDKLYTCAPRCDPPRSCDDDSTCDTWGGTPCCLCSAAVPTCVPPPTPGPMMGPLRIRPTSGTAGQPVTLIIEGAPFYVGALFYLVRVEQEVKMEEPAGEGCAIAVTFTPPQPGSYVIEVSQYGGGAPWILAGFFAASGGVIPHPTLQPGYSCTMTPAPGDPTCAAAPPYTCSCVAGRCRCQ